MQARNVMKKASKIWFFLGMVLVGAIFLVVGILVASAPKGELIDGTAVISEIEEYYDSFEGETRYNVYVDYTDINGEHHTHVLYPSYAFTMHENDEVKIQYDINDPESLSDPGGAFLIYVIIAIGGICVVVGLIMTVKTIKTKSSDFDEFNRVDATKANPIDVERVQTNDEPIQEYYFHFAKKLNQSFVLEDKDRSVIYEADCEKIKLFGSTPFTFIDHRSGRTQKFEVSHTVTTSYGTHTGSVSFSSVSSSKFKLNGENVWDYIAKRGYSLQPHLNGLGVDFEIFRYGIKVATLYAAGTNILKDGADSKLGNLPAQGLYRVECKDEDLEMVFMCCFTVSRIQLF